MGPNTEVCNLRKTQLNWARRAKAHSRQAKANPLVPTLQRGNAVSTLQRRVFQKSLYIGNGSNLEL